MENESILSPVFGSKRKFVISNQDEESAGDCDFIPKKPFTKEQISIGTETTSKKELPDSGEEISLELLREIFKHLSFNDLKTCRLVNRLWNTEATKLLLKNFRMKPIHVISEMARSHSSCLMELSEFKNLIQSSQIFPCNSFSVSNILLKQLTKKFFGAFGHLVKSLHFKVDIYSLRRKYFETCDGKNVMLLISEHLPNLETLTVKFAPRIPEDVANSVIGVVHIKKLRTLTLKEEVSPSFVSTIMKIAPNLNKIYLRLQNSYSKCLKQLVNVKAIPFLKNIRLIVGKNTYNLLEQLLEQDPKFETIETIEFCEEDDLARIGRILTKMFHQSSQSLKEICVLPSLGYLPGMKIPVLPNVTSTCIHYFESKHETPNVVVPFFPPQVNFQQTFPALQKLDLHFGSFEELRSKEIFPESSTPLPSVKSLKVFSVKVDHILIPEIWMKQFRTLFPNISKADFWEMSFPAMELVWGFHSLEDLKLALEAGENLNLFPQWDSAFTGFSHETVRRLHQKSPASLEMFEESEVRALRVKPSVADLKKLKQLCLELLHDVTDFEDKEDRDAVIAFGPGASDPVLMFKDQLIISHVTKRFGFEMCPELKSNISIRLTDLDSDVLTMSTED